jgi:hypothetical protein
MASRVSQGGSEKKRLMETLVSVGALDEAMEIAIHFMGKASRQIAYSDEGTVAASLLG